MLWVVVFFCLSKTEADHVRSCLYCVVLALVLFYHETAELHLDAQTAAAIKRVVKVIFAMKNAYHCHF